MSWQTEMTTLLRYVINDTDATSYEFTDSRLQTLIVSSAQMTLGVVDFPRDYNIDIPSTGITPDPTAANDNGFINLVVLKSACMLADGEYRTASNKGIVIRDGPSSVDARALIASKQQIASDSCAKYEKAELEFRLGNSNAGEAIIGPHRNAAYGGSNSQKHAR